MEKALQNRRICDIITAMKVYVSHSEAETIEWAKAYAATLKTGDVVLLEGEMGAGKTMLAKGLIAGMGIPDEVTSPTYAYVNEYGGRVFHFDCYRIESAAQAYGLGLFDYFGRGGVCIVEWGESIRELLPDGCKTIRIRKTGKAREIEF